MDKKTLRRAFANVAKDFDDTDFFHREIGERLLDRLQVINCEPQRLVNLGSGTGRLSAELQNQFPAATVIGIDHSLAMLNANKLQPQAVCGEASALPLRDQSADLVIANLLLQHCADPTATLQEVRRILNSQGLFLFTTLGPGSLIELGRAWATADSFTHINPFIDIKDLGTLLGQCGFAEPVLDAQTLTITYTELPKLLAELKATGSVNATPGRNPGLTGRHAWERFSAAYNQLRDSGGKLPVTLEVIFGIAWAGSPRTSAKSAEGEIEVTLESLLNSRQTDS